MTKQEKRELLKKHHQHRGRKKAPVSRFAKRPTCPVELEPFQFYFHGNVPSMKNNKNIGCKDKNGKALNRPAVRLSDDAKAWLESMAAQQLSQFKKWEKVRPKDPKDLYKVVIMYQFIRPNKRSVFDLSNAVEIIQDALTASAYTPQSKAAKATGKLKHVGKLGQQVPNLRKYLAWLKDDNNTRVVPAFHPVDLYDEDAHGVILSFFFTFKDYVDFLVSRKIGV